MINICDNNNNIYMIYIKQIYNSIEVYMYVIMYSLVKVGKKIRKQKKKNKFLSKSLAPSVKQLHV